MHGVRRRQSFEIALRRRPMLRPAYDCDLEVAGSVRRSDYGLDAWRIAVRDRVRFACCACAWPRGRLMAAWRALAAALLALSLSACVGPSAIQREGRNGGRGRPFGRGHLRRGRHLRAALAAARRCPRTRSPRAPAPRRGISALILDDSRDAMLARINLIRSATTSIDLQTYIFSEDDVGPPGAGTNCWRRRGAA